MFQRLERLIIVAILMLPAAQGLAFELVVDRGAPLLLDPVTTQQYQAFLAMTRLQLLDQNPGLVFPEQMTSGGQLMSFLDSSVPNFVNRPHNCRFLERIRSTLHNPPAAADLDALTRHGTICVSGDLPADQQDAWVVQMANFLWSKPWIPRNGKNLNLHQLVLEKIGIQEDADVEVLPWRGVDHFDATLSDLSSGDRALCLPNRDLGVKG